MMLPFRVQAALICDDVRREVGGKNTLVGVVAGTILVSHFPVEMNVSLYVHAYPHVTGPFNGELRVVGPNDAVLVTGPTAGNFKELKQTVMVFQGIMLQIQSAGRIQFQMRTIGLDEWETVVDFEATLRPPRPAPQASSAKTVG